MTSRLAANPKATLTSVGPRSHSSRSAVTAPTACQSQKDRSASRLILQLDPLAGYEDRALFPYFEAAPAEFRPKTLIIEHGQKHHWERDCLALCASLGYQAVWRSKLNTVLERS